MKHVEADEDVMQELRSLREEVKRLRCIREDEAFIDEAIQELSHTAERSLDKTILGTPKPTALNSTIGIQEMIGDAGPWQLVTSSTGKQRNPPPFSPSSSFSLKQGSSTPTPQLSLKNRFHVLQEGTDEDEAEEDSEHRTPAAVLAARSTPPRKERRVVVIGDSMLRGTEGPICRPDLQSREVPTILPEAHQTASLKTSRPWEEN
uniref:Uncharacterized protein LOC117368300 n=1 Tax=Geotrypetes seraphini TaxID=260995 RepID=A0A6P8SN19_GEOSA|nr:uncharacterized protein LOC117368300 [Geotrypetes seraphini]